MSDPRAEAGQSSSSTCSEIHVDLPGGHSEALYRRRKQVSHHLLACFDKYRLPVKALRQKSKEGDIPCIGYKLIIDSI